MLSVVSRAKEIEALSKTGMMPVDMKSWRASFPPVPVFRALLANDELDDAGMYAARALAFALNGHEKEARDNIGWAERSLSRYEWAVNASGKEIYLYEVDWYQATRI